ncbi:MAG: hypothetical protein M3384_20135 [Acidobacteriota bacterium]|nr:hypothetical protein [Acidobacteriota bacterium]
MKNKSYTKINTWLVVITIVVSLCALNPDRAKRIACKFAVVFELYDNVKTCQFGCSSSQNRPRRKQERNKRKSEDCQSAAIKPSRLSLLGFDNDELTLLGIISLIGLLVFGLTRKSYSSGAP